ncbi:MAG: T9SS type A sorting domain-containing protein [Sphingobacteriales bacterium]|nr:MAG: T9SS type A sorting domain-containing protein [Sphingobacteriales bacterium]
MHQLYKLCFGALLALSTQPLMAQSQFFNPLKAYNAQEDQKVLQAAFNKFNSFKLFEQDIDQVREFATKSAQKNITIPLPDGRIIDFKIRNSEVLSAAFEKEHPGLKALKGSSADGAFTIRLTLSPMGFMGKVREAATGKTWYFEPLDPQQPGVLVAYSNKDIKMTADNMAQCLTQDNVQPEGMVAPMGGQRLLAAYGDCLVRTYRMAVTTTGEYTTGAGGQANANIRVANSVNNVSEIFERDVTVRFQLVTNNSLIYPDPASDPFAAGLNGTATLTEAINVFNSNPGTAAFDVGIVFGEGAGWGGGIAYLGGGCNNSIKGGSAAGLSTGSTGYNFDNVVAHEIAHQFGATHTMSANTGQCGGGNHSPASSWETGGGSSLMAYAGVCTGLAYQNASDDYFHAGSIGQIITKLATATCASSSASNNASPATSTSGNTFNIPHSTPFKLSVTATDGTDVLTYAFDQMDAYGGSGINTLPSATATSGPLFRSMYPSSANTRYFPSLSVLTGISSGSYEVLPTVARTINFRAVVRDNRDEAGCVAQENFVINTQNCGAFEFTNLNTATSLTANGTNTVNLTWNIAACVPTANIRILFSTDGGKTFPHIVSNSTANDGTETLIVPNLPTCDGRFMIEALGNIYFNINRGKIDISSGCIANGTTFTPDNAISESTNSPNLDLSLSPAFSNSTIANPVSGQILATDINDNLTLPNNTYTSCSDFSNAIKYKTITIYPSVTGSYTFPAAASIVVKLYAGDYDPTNKCNALLGSNYTFNGGASNAAFTVSLCKDQKYTLFLSTFGPSAYPFNYSLNVTVPGGATFNNGSTNPNLNYFYVIVNNTGNLVHKIVTDPDMRSASDYPTGNYTVYGLSTSSTLAGLGAYENGPFPALQTAALNQTGGLCAQLSANSKSVMIITPTPTHLLSFEARKTPTNTALLSWKATEDHDAGQYILERSEDGQQFSPISSTAFAAFNKLAEKSYAVEDLQFSTLKVQQVFYRLRISSFDGSHQLSNVRMLKHHYANNLEATIHPNPVGREMLTIDLGNSGNGAYQLQLFDVLGKTILSKQVMKTAANSSFKLDLQQEASGIYYLKVSGGDKVKTFKVVK